MDDGINRYRIPFIDIPKFVNCRQIPYFIRVNCSDYGIISCRNKHVKASILGYSNSPVQFDSVKINATGTVQNVKTAAIGDIYQFIVTNEYIRRCIEMIPKRKQGGIPYFVRHQLRIDATLLKNFIGGFIPLGSEN